MLSKPEWTTRAVPASDGDTANTDATSELMMDSAGTFQVSNMICVIFSTTALSLKTVGCIGIATGCSLPGSVRLGKKPARARRNSGARRSSL